LYLVLSFAEIKLNSDDLLAKFVVDQTDRAELVKPKAYVVLKAGYVPSAELEREPIVYCREQMAEYKRPR
jgi:benzoate-CoA ligase